MRSATLHPDTVGLIAGGATWVAPVHEISDGELTILLYQRHSQWASKEVDIRSDVTGSDHCPVEIEVKL